MLEAGWEKKGSQISPVKFIIFHIYKKESFSNANVLSKNSAEIQL